jgi:hypothetical protein
MENKKHYLNINFHDFIGLFLVVLGNLTLTQLLIKELYGDNLLLIIINKW